VTDGILPSYGRETVAEALDTADPDDGTVVGVLLAGGTSSRFGASNKLLAELDGQPLVRHAARSLLDADLPEVVAVVGYDADTVSAALTDLDVRVVRNPDYRMGLSTSVGRGVEAAADAGADAVVFLPGDMPGVDPATVELLVDACRAGLGTALAAGHEGQRGNPVLFADEHFEELRAVEGDVGGRSVLLGSDDAALIETGDPGVAEDVDTTEDLRRQR